jgi:hypothetical protein
MTSWREPSSTALWSRRAPRLAWLPGLCSRDRDHCEGARGGLGAKIGVGHRGAMTPRKFFV